MTDFTEFEGKNVDKALEIASKELGKSIKELQYDVVSYGSTGIFGFVGVKKAKIRVKIGSNGEALDSAQEVQDTARDLVAAAFDAETEAPPKETEVPAKQEEPESDLTELAAVGEKALRKVLDYICEEAKITIDIQNGRIVYKIEGGNSGLLIGKRGQTLEAIQYLVEKIVNRQNGSRVRVLVDVEGYLSTRKINLKRIATKMAAKAQKMNKPVTIGQMNAYDRRIVHLHLKDNQDVRTQSMGDGYYRKLVIFPKKRRRGKSDN
ncbi:MAG: Jag N-terminal domain-containing protein [Desulfatitalea sp.]|nr:Jag N-terminal domain-containing protein [Desulfatitalea sp.]